MKTEQTPAVRRLDKAHLEAVAALEISAQYDPRLVYEGIPWTGGGIREYLRGGRGLVAINYAGTVVGYTLFHVPYDGEALCVVKLVAPARPAHVALYNQLIAVAAQQNKSELRVPLILELG